MNKQQVFWNVKTLTQVLDVSLDDIMLFTRLGLIPSAVRVKHKLLWRVADVRSWARELKVETPSEAVAALWTEWLNNHDPRKNTTFGSEDDWNPLNVEGDTIDE